jgi:hypothetical protein
MSTLAYNNACIGWEGQGLETGVAGGTPLMALRSIALAQSQLRHLLES